MQQFQELYTEEGRKSVKISTFVANQRNQQHQQQQQQQQQQPLNQILNNTLQQNHGKTQLQQQPPLQRQLNQPATTKVVSSSTSTTTTAQSVHTIVTQGRTFTVAQNPVISHGGNTYILASSALQQSLNLGTSVVPMSLSNSFTQSLVSGNVTFTVSGMLCYWTAVVAI